MRPSAKMAAAWFLAAGVGCAQSTLETLNPLGAQSHGLRLSNVSLFGGYTSVRMPEGSSLAGALPPGTNPVTGGELLLRWDHSGPRGGFSLSYTPSYSALPGHSEWNAANHALTFSLNRKLSGKWNLGLALNGEATSSNQMLFNPSVLSRVAGVEMTFEDLAARHAVGHLHEQRAGGHPDGLAGVGIVPRASADLRKPGLEHHRHGLSQLCDRRECPFTSVEAFPARSI